MFIAAPILSPVGLALVASEWLDENERTKEEQREEAYLKAPTVGEYFKRAGWKYSELVERYDNQTANDIKYRFDEFLKLKGMSADERVQHCSNPEILIDINEKSFAEIKKIRDGRLMEWALFHKYRDDVRKAYGIVYPQYKRAATKDDQELQTSLISIGLILISLIALASFGGVIIGKIL